jgi:hypothetical protein
VTVIHGAPLTGDHEQPPETFTVKLPVPPAALKPRELGVSENVQLEGAACATLNVFPATVRVPNLGEEPDLFEPTE